MFLCGMSSLKLNIILVLLALVSMASQVGWKPTLLTLDYPETWPNTEYDQERNPLTKEGVWLGRNLFYDPQLSKDNSISCASCHLSFTAFTHVDHALSHGIDDRIGTRNSPVLINLAWNKSFMWDGAANHLDYVVHAKGCSCVSQSQSTLLHQSHTHASPCRTSSDLFACATQ